MLDNETVVAAIYTVVFVLRIPLLLLESQQKWKHATIPPEEIPPERRQGIFGRTFFWWLNPLFIKGYTRDLTMDDLFAIDDDIKGEKLYDRLIKHWNKGPYASRSTWAAACLTSVNS